MFLTILLILVGLLIFGVIALIGLNLWLTRTARGQKAALRLGLRIAKILNHFPKARAWMVARQEKLMKGQAGPGGRRPGGAPSASGPGAAAGVDAMLKQLTPEQRAMIESSDLSELTQMAEDMGVSLSRDQQRQLGRVQGAVRVNPQRQAQRAKQVAKRRAAKKHAR